MAQPTQAQQSDSVTDNAVGTLEDTTSSASAFYYDDTESDSGDRYDSGDLTDDITDYVTGVAEAGLRAGAAVVDAINTPFR